MNSTNNQSFRDRIDAVKDLLDPIYLIESLGFKVTNETVKEVRAVCIIHGGDNTTAFRVNKDLKTWTCFTHKCHEKYGNDMIGLIRSVKECGFIEALTYLEDITGSRSLSRKKLFEFKRKREQKAFIKQISGACQEKPSVVDDTKLKYYKPFRSSLFNGDGFSDETLDHFEVAGGYTDCDGIVRDIIPIRDDKGELVAYSLRDIRPDTPDKDKKYKLTPGFDKDAVLYNLYRIKDLLQDKPLIIVEGFKGVWRLYDCGIYNVVACMGSGITTGQAGLLFTHANKGIVTFYDNDYAGVQALGRTYDLLKGKLNVTAQIITETDEEGNGLDPAELTEEQIHYYLSEYK